MDDKKKQAFGIGITVLLLLAVMTVGEFGIGFYASVWWAPLLGIGVLKASFIIRDYMHLGQLFASDDEEH